jgi:hypothetical protein
LTSGITDATPGEPKSKQKRKHPNLTIFIICLFISIVMWMMIRLSREYTEMVRVSVIYKGLQSDKIILPASDTVFLVSLQTSGYNILFRNFSRQHFRLEIDLSQYPAKLQGNNYAISVDLSDLRDQVAVNFKQKEKILSFAPENLNVMLDKAFIKKVPVLLDAEMSFQKQYCLYHKIYFDPDSVMVTGNEDLLKTIESVTTEKRIFNNLSSNTSVSLKLVNNSHLNLRYSSEYVKVFIPVVQFSDDYIEIPVTPDSLSSLTHFTTVPEKVKVFYTVCVPDIKKVSASQFHVTIPASELIQTGNHAKVELRKFPSIVKIQRIEPDYVEFNIHK